MKHFISFILVLFMLSPTAAFANGIDFSILDTDEIRSIISQGEAELKAREITEDGHPVIADSNELTVYLTGRYYIDVQNQDNVVLHMEAVFINNCDKDIQVIPKSICINSWECSFDLFTNLTEISAYKMRKADIAIMLSDAECSTLEEIHDVDYSFNVYDANNIAIPFASTQPMTYIRG